MSNEKEGMLMQQEEKHGFVPKLRFPEFRDADAWKFVPLNKQAKRCIQKNRDGVITRVLTNSAEYGVVDQRDYFDKDIATQGNLKNYYVVKKGDYVYNPRISAAAPVGPISKNNVETGVMSPLYSVFRFGDSNNDFYAYYFQTAGWHQYMRQASSTGARHDRMAITNDDFMAMPLPASTPEEQQKIADCLSSLDDLIRLEAEKLDAITAHKNGLMQQLFPAEGETLPKLRFPEFLEAGEWEETTIGEVGRFYYGKSAPKWSLEEDAPTRCVRYGELYTKFGAVITETYSRTNIDPSSLRFSKGGEILVPRVGEKPEDFGKCCSYLPLKDIAIGEMISVFETKQNPLFYTYYFRNMYRQFAKVVEGQNVKNLYYVELEPLPLCRPSLPEQKKIADLLVSLDDVIADQSRKIDVLKTHKRGLLQQLFPMMDEVME
ncbi:restriction endonuclease subunit S [Pseudomonas aeruginosa]|uniref:restriction endonuclease subunit S n=1 Tax=Pseudomonas aeruginosa TaxID=287 RepID=UPI000FD5BD99|nr:restriction endonuclease subunit S [Pseudomonas aeruginosa]MDU0612110.1 restriction endonuclease subunit S [Pseudomonas aeruginosa]RUF15787.1 restriction endonuclease subunit S [Pseudomonas aeruginosa]